MLSAMGMEISKLKAIAAAVVGALLFTALPSSAQYFGRNKVQYDDFDFKIMKTEHFDIYYYPPEKAAAEDAARMVERWQDRLEVLFDHELTSRQPLILYADHPDFQQTNVISGQISQGTGGVTEGMKRRIVLPLTGSFKANDHVIGHELVHAFQYDIMNNSAGGMRAGGNIPLWMIEGMSEYLSIGREDPLTAMWMRDAVLYDDLPTIQEVSKNMKYFPYRYGHAIWSYITNRWGDEAVRLVFGDALRANLVAALEGISEMKLDSLSGDWNQSVRSKFEPQLAGRTMPDSAGTRLIGGGGGMNLAPSVSPDGSRVAFISRRDLFTLDLYIADAASGKIIRKLVSNETDSHFDALRFMDSAGSWSPDGNRFAFVVINDGDNELAVADVTSGRILQRRKIDGVSAITQLSWSPDGNRIALNGLHGGISDLYIYDMQSGHVNQLTDDRYANMQPDWSPDGRKIVMVTDRGRGTDLNELKFGPMKPAILDLQSGAIELLAIPGAGKHIDPHYSPDGASLYFVADPDGISDIYRYSFDSGNYYRVTRIATGVSGLTEMSPALSVARNSGRLVFSVFEKTNYYLNTMTAGQAAGEQFYPDTEAYEKHVSLVSNRKKR